MSGKVRVSAVTGEGSAALASRTARDLAGVKVDGPLAAIDALVVVSAYAAALSLRMIDGVDDPAMWWSSLARSLPLMIAVHLFFNVVAGAYGHVWQYASISEARRVVAASLASAMTLIGGTLILGIRPVPLSALLAGGLMALLGFGGVRFRSRLFPLRRILGLAPASRERALILGTGRRAVEVARHYQDEPDDIDVVGFISPRPEPAIRLLAGLPILGSIGDVPRLVREAGVDQLIVGAHDGDEVIRQLVAASTDVDVRLRVVPALGDVLQNHGTGGELGSFDLAELLERPPVLIDVDAIGEVIKGRRVAVTGAGGFVGAEMVSRVLTFGPEAVIALDHDGTHLLEAALQWDPPPGSDVIQALCDIRDRPQVERLFLRHRPDVVFHAAAHKHVPILEAWPEEAVKANIVGTANVLEAARTAGVERFVLISTVKAGEPEGVMGASKRIAEMLVQTAAEDSPEGRCFASVRSGNVLGSRGSVVPTFIAQIRRGGPVTVAHEAMTRYFLTVDELVDLTLQASVLASRGEVFVLDMGEPVRIFDLAQRLIKMVGVVRSTGIEVQFSGLRPGDRLEEDAAYGPRLATSHPSITVAEAPFPEPTTLRAIMRHLDDLAVSGNADELRRLIVAFARGEWDLASDLSTE